jgi:hypothetical protein
LVMRDTFDRARARVLAEWELVSRHVPAGVPALVFPLRAISLLPEENRPMFDGEPGSISVARDYLGESNDPTSTAVIVTVHVGDSLSAAAFAEGKLVVESGEPFPAAAVPVERAEVVPEIVEKSAEQWGEAQRHLPDEILDSLGEVQSLLISDESSSVQIHCAHGFIVVERDHLEEPNAMGSTTAVRVLSYPREALEVGVRYQAVYSDRELVESGKSRWRPSSLARLPGRLTSHGQSDPFGSSMSVTRRTFS